MSTRSRPSWPTFLTCCTDERSEAAAMTPPTASVARGRDANRRAAARRRQTAARRRRYLLDEYGGRIVPALAAYNGGEANVSHWLAQARARGHHFSLRDIPFPETRAYVERVLHAQRDYRHSYASELGYR